MNKTNCPNCEAPIIFGMVKCPYCETPYEAPGGSESGELNRDIESRKKLEKVIRSRRGTLMKTLRRELVDI